jgi:hypothetical protein
VRRNSLRRDVDRVETLARVVAILLLGCVVPVALAVGAAVHRHDAAIPPAFRVSATIVRDAPATVGYGSQPTYVAASASWRTGDGARHAGAVSVLPPARRGERVTMFVDRAGRPTDPPLTAGVILIEQIAAVTTVMSLSTILLGSLLFLVHRWLNAVRFARWDRDWLLFSFRRGDPLRAVALRHPE